jgi:hypothetical protein
MVLIGGNVFWLPAEGDFLSVVVVFTQKDLELLDIKFDFEEYDEIDEDLSRSNCEVDKTSSFSSTSPKFIGILSEKDIV